jgi:SAM-dependent methyltransferase
MRGVFCATWESPSDTLAEMLNISLLVNKAVREARKVGLRRFMVEAVHRFSYRVPADDFDQVNGTDTGGRVPLWRFRIPYPSARFGASYLSPSPTRIRDALGNVPRHATLVDLGSGKGRALIIAARMGFRRVIGVEFAAELADIARRNLALTGSRAEVILGDAGEYAFPGGPLGIYLYNPFSGEIMRKVAAQLEGRSEETWVAYLNPGSEPGCVELFDAIMERTVESHGLIVWSPRKKNGGRPQSGF